MKREIECEGGLAAARQPGEQHRALGGHDLDRRKMVGRPGRHRIGELA